MLVAALPEGVVSRAYARLPWAAWHCADEGERAAILQKLRESAERMDLFLESDEPQHYGAEPFYLLKGTAVWVASECRASAGLLMRHTCGRDKREYLQGNPHSHDEIACVDWAHCSRTSDEQR
jgi:hypothetical protein